MENWKTLDEFPNYEVSNYGNVRNKTTGELLKPRIVGSRNVYYYAVALYNNKERKNIKIHRLVALIFIPNPDDKPCVDHIDNNRFNNNYENLRWATRKENGYNMRGHGKLGYKGVRNHGKKFQAQIRIDGKVKALGTYNTPEEAHEAYKKAAMEHYGEFARFE